MLLPLLLALATVAAQDEPTVTVRLNQDQFEIGDRGRIYVRTARDGYLVILHADPQGRIRVLFPIDPGEDNFVRGDRQFELRSRSDREALHIDASGTGTVVAVFSLDAYTFDELTRNGHWDFLALGGPDESVKNDPLAGLLEIANNMARENPYDYDVATYVVAAEQIAAEYGYGGDGHGHLGIHFGFGYYPFGFGFGYGYPYYAPFYVVPFGGWYGGYGYGTSVVAYSRKGLGTLGRFEPNQPRPRSGFSEPLSVRGRSFEPRARSIEPRRVEPRSRSIAPRGRSTPSRFVTPRGTTSRPSVGSSRSIFRSFSGGFGGFGGSRGGFSGSRGGFSTGARRR
ncbi:MAG TPA: DUF4384 domain-containing protein [Gemmatimonadales bacterium]|nr:DUF4384 domain-containing protein [Gemmatimonadales bacterium]